ncbi:NAD(P)H-hydrate dehydratase [Novosphingobium sp. FKTRR1]|uniref:NAD(P)H-hydrate dehydratase n=1 Tax=Novosphingobium sp. FKTRR1 TaxID=2879118 RepID=UPI001CF0C94A|nr:NAD(P)H-hydrate dehydratase [Novosphingobium sp. FKTRR1]
MPRHPDADLAQVLTVAQTRAAEAALIAAGTGEDALMQIAGHGAGEYVRRIAAGRVVTVLCGPGNNGGDGYVIAQHLAANGNPVKVLAAMEPVTQAAWNARNLFTGHVVGPEGATEGGDVLVDCLFGSGLTRPLAPETLALLQQQAAKHRHVIAIDLPSGVESDSGVALNPGLPHNDLTVSLGAWKHAHFAMPACASLGALRLVDIGLGAMPGAARILERPRMVAPAPDAHKYRRGLLGIVVGDMPGAAIMAAEAAQRAGAGYVRLLAQDPGWRAGNPVPPELVVTLGGVDDPRMAALLVGPGLGRGDAARALLADLLAQGRPTVIDADALMLLGPDLALPPIAVLTPHEGEMAALEHAFGSAGTGLRRERALALAALSRAVVVLKGPDTVIAAPDGRLVVGPRASSWLSVAGTGDVLAGTIASRLAVHPDPVQAAGEGLWLHGRAAALAGAAFTASGLAHAIRDAMATAIAV